MNIQTILGIIVSLLILTVIVFVHELGHFLTAKKFGVYCREFAIGMGNKLWSKQKGETQYSVRMLPIGGFVQMIGEDADDVVLPIGKEVFIAFDEEQKVKVIAQKQLQGFPEMKQVILKELNRTQEPLVLTYLDIETEMEHQAACCNLIDFYEDAKTVQPLVAKTRQFTYKKPWQKIIILTAGVTMNFIFAFIFIFASTAISGVSVDPIIKYDLYAEESGANSFQTGDRIVSIDNKKMPTSTETIAYVQANPGKTVLLSVERNGQLVEITKTLKSSETEALGKNGIEKKTIGVLGVQYQKQHYFGAIVQTSFKQYFGMFQQMFATLALLFTGKINITQLSGFIGIAQATNTVIQGSSTSSNGSFFSGILPSLLSFTAFLSVAIGVTNLLPIPALDGGRVIFAVYELFTKKRANAKFEFYVNFVGFALLMGMFVLITIFDVAKLFN